LNPGANNRTTTGLSGLFSGWCLATNKQHVTLSTKLPLNYCRRLLESLPSGCPWRRNLLAFRTIFQPADRKSNMD
jgi:hypothetical protein